MLRDFQQGCVVRCREDLGQDLENVTARGADTDGPDLVIDTTGMIAAEAEIGAGCLISCVLRTPPTDVTMCMPFQEACTWRLWGGGMQLILLLS